MLLEGAGLANVLTADDPKIFTAPQSLSFGNIDVSTGAQTSALLLTLSDAGNGAGTWAVTVAPQVADDRRRRSRSRHLSCWRRAGTRRSPSSSTPRPPRSRARTTASSS